SSPPGAASAGKRSGLVVKLRRPDRGGVAMKTMEVMTDIAHPEVVSRDEWLGERKKLLRHEKELTKHRDQFNAQRRRLPMVKSEKNYVFDGPGEEEPARPVPRPPAAHRLPLHVRSEMGQRLPG